MKKQLAKKLPKSLIVGLMMIGLNAHAFKLTCALVTQGTKHLEVVPGTSSPAKYDNDTFIFERRSMQAKGIDDLFYYGDSVKRHENDCHIIFANYGSRADESSQVNVVADLCPGSSLTLESEKLKGVQLNCSLER